MNPKKELLWSPWVEHTWTLENFLGLIQGNHSKLTDQMPLKSRGPIPLHYESLYGI